MDLDWEMGDMNPEDFAPDAKIQIIVKLNRDKIGELGVTTQTSVHEFGIHVMKYLALIKTLRSETAGLGFMNAWISAKELGQYLDGIKQHQDYWLNKDADYNTIHNEVKVQMKDPALQKSFDDERARDERNMKRNFPLQQQ